MEVERIRKVFLEDLPMKTYRGMNCINWQLAIGYIVKFTYDGIEGEIEIVDYDIKKQSLFVKYLDRNTSKISAFNFIEGKLGSIIGRYTKEFKINIGTILKDDKRDITITDKEYRINKRGQKCKWYKYTCNKCGWTEGWMVEGSLIGKNKTQGCSCCCGRTAVLGINTIWDTDKWMVDLGVSEKDAKTHTRRSDKKIIVLCPDCRRTKIITISNICRDSNIRCVCSDNIPYTEKIIFNVLSQLNIDFKIQLTKTTFEWCDKYRYDFYFKHNNEEHIIETNGIQHYQQTTGYFIKTLEEEQVNDMLKKELALGNGIKEENYIIIDCRKSELEFIKQNILNSRLSELFDFSIIDWDGCGKFAVSNLCKIACDYKKNNTELTTLEIALKMKLNRVTIIRYLKIGTKFNWCYYNPKEEMINSAKRKINNNGKLVEVFKYGESLGIFPSCHEVDRISEELFGVKISYKQISDVCLNKRKECKNFIFKYK